MVGATGEGPATVIGERMTAVGLLLAREWDVADVASRLGEGAEARYEPTWDADRGEFTWGFGLGEDHRRGQYNAIMAAAEAVTPGAWTALANAAAPAVPAEVTGVDFPTVTMTQATWLDGVLRLATSPMNDAMIGSPTSWRVTGLADPARWTVAADGDAPVGARVESRELVVETVVGEHSYTVRPVGR
jgi:hypothetical protein